jgi:hypothetical protein
MAAPTQCEGLLEGGTQSKGGAHERQIVDFNLPLLHGAPYTYALFSSAQARPWFCGFRSNFQRFQRKPAARDAMRFVDHIGITTTEGPAVDLDWREGLVRGLTSSGGTPCDGYSTRKTGTNCFARYWL